MTEAGRQDGSCRRLRSVEAAATPGAGAPLKDDGLMSEDFGGAREVRKGRISSAWCIRHNRLCGVFRGKLQEVWR
jgi:hypothetical protein